MKNKRAQGGGRLFIIVPLIMILIFGIIVISEFRKEKFNEQICKDIGYDHLIYQHGETLCVRFNSNISNFEYIKFPEEELS